MKYQIFVSGAASSRSRNQCRVNDNAAEEQRHVVGYSGDVIGRRVRTSSGGDGAAYPQDGRMPSFEVNARSCQSEKASAGAPSIRRFPPVIQFLTDVDVDFRKRLQTICVDMHSKGNSLQDVCRELYVCARAEGFELSLAVQQVFSTQMPSFPNQTVQTALLLADAKPIVSSAAYRYSRVAV